jgi:hypothetical protein
MPEGAESLEKLAINIIIIIIHSFITPSGETPIRQLYTSGK